MAELDDYKKANPHLKQIISPSHISYQGGFSNKSLPGDWKNILSNMKKGYRGSTINDGV
jgi:hypothetical protein